MGSEHFDVIIIGAGISGICFAYRLQEQHPELRYCMLESQGQIGGTWSFFKYPGLRSDSDLYTFGFPWQPWTKPNPIAKGPAIVEYMQDTIKNAGIDRHVRLKHSVQKMSWSSQEKRWTAKVKANESPQVMTARFIILATGYYDYCNPLQADIPGISSFRGQVVHPQFWPEDLDYAGKEIAIIGSGATAITLLPSLAGTAKHVTMLQRSPSYIMSVPVKDRLESIIRGVLPQRLAAKLIRLKWIIMPTIFRTYCTLFPSRARKYMRKLTQAEIGEKENLEPNFSPTYNPFDQRMCLCPGGDFYQCLRDGRSSIKTGSIERVEADRIKLKSGEEMHPDVIVTATGLKLQLGGGIQIEVDGNPYLIQDHYVWKGLMFEGLPNLAFSFGYFDASWTLGVDLSAQLACRLLEQMQRESLAAIVPERSLEEKETMQDVKFLPLSSTYVQKALSVLPKLGNRRQWGPRSTYLWELFSVRFGDTHSGLKTIML